MKVRFEYSLADLADVAERSNKRSKTIHEWRRQTRATWAALADAEGAVGLLVVRDRAFETREQRSEFLRVSRDFLAQHAADLRWVGPAGGGLAGLPVEVS